MIRTRPSLPCLSRHLKRTGIKWASSASSGRAGILDHWTPDKLQTTEKYPLSLELSEKVNPQGESILIQRKKGNSQPKKKKTATKSYSRPQIVSPGLCGMSSPESDLVDM